VPLVAKLFAASGAADAPPARPPHAER